MSGEWITVVKKVHAKKHEHTIRDTKPYKNNYSHHGEFDPRSIGDNIRQNYTRDQGEKSHVNTKGYGQKKEMSEVPIRVEIQTLCGAFGRKIEENSLTREHVMEFISDLKALKLGDNNALLRRINSMCTHVKAAFESGNIKRGDVVEYVKMAIPDRDDVDKKFEMEFICKRVKSIYMDKSQTLTEEKIAQYVEQLVNLVDIHPEMVLNRAVKYGILGFVKQLTAAINRADKKMFITIRNFRGFRNLHNAVYPYLPYNINDIVDIVTFLKDEGESVMEWNDKGETVFEALMDNTQMNKDNMNILYEALLKIQPKETIKIITDVFNKMTKENRGMCQKTLCWSLWQYPSVVISEYIKKLVHMSTNREDKLYVDLSQNFDI